MGNATNMYVKRFDEATDAWDAEPTWVSDGVANAQIATVGVDGHGNAIVAYDQGAPNNYSLIMGARYVATSGRWSDPTPLNDTVTYYGIALVSVARNGVATLLFGAEYNENTGPAMGRPLPHLQVGRPSVRPDRRVALGGRTPQFTALTTSKSLAGR